MIHKICRLESEVKVLRKQLHVHEEVNSKISDIEHVLKQGNSRQDIYEEKLCDLEKLLHETLLDHENERKNLMKQFCKEQNENSKRKEFIERFAEDVEKLKRENLKLKEEVEARRKQMIALEAKEYSDFSEMDELVRTLKVQKSELKTLCSNLKAELEREHETERMLEMKIEELNEDLEFKTQEVKYVNLV